MRFVNFPTCAGVNGVLSVRRELFQPTPEGEARLLLLINAFSVSNAVLEGRTKLAKLDFFIRYPTYLRRALAIRSPELVAQDISENDDNVETRMVRYRYGPWDPSYFALLGSLIGKGLVETAPTKSGMGYRTTHLGKHLAKDLARNESWHEIVKGIKLLKSNFDLSGSTLKNFIYEHFPEIADAAWGKQL